MTQLLQENTFFDYHFFQRGAKAFLNPTVTVLRKWSCDRVPVENENDVLTGTITGIEAGIMFIGYMSTKVTAANVNAGHAVLKVEASTNGGSVWQPMATLNIDGATPPSVISAGLNAVLPLTTVGVPCTTILFRVSMDMSTTMAADSINTEFITVQMLFNPLNQQEINPAV